MKISAGFDNVGAFVATGIASIMLASSVNAETALTVNGAAIDSEVVNLYVESRTQRPAAQVTAAERESLIGELTDIYLLSTQPQAKELAMDARTAAQMELQKRSMLAQAVATDFMTKNTATDEEILAEYAQQIELAPPQQYKARHILVETQETADGLISQLEDGADFETLAQENSTGPSGPSGGDLGWFAPNQMVKPFADAVGALTDGEFTKVPVQTQFGWHVILRESSRASEPPTLEGVRDVIKQRLEQQKLQAYLTSLREKNAN